MSETSSHLGDDQPERTPPAGAKRSVLAREEIEALLGAGSDAAEPAQFVEEPAKMAQRDNRPRQQQEIDRDTFAQIAPREARTAADEPAATDAESLLRRTEASLAELTQARDRTALPQGAQSYRLHDFVNEMLAADRVAKVDTGGGQLPLRIELGRTHVTREEVRQLRNGSVVLLDNASREPVDLFVDDRLVGRGEILVMEGKFCLRVLEVIARPMAQAS